VALINKVFMGAAGKTKFARVFHDIVFIESMHVFPSLLKMKFVFGGSCQVFDIKSFVTLYNIIPTRHGQAVA
jgi:hypothetical protein